MNLSDVTQPGSGRPRLGGPEPLQALEVSFHGLFRLLFFLDILSRTTRPGGGTAAPVEAGAFLIVLFAQGSISRFLRLTRPGGGTAPAFLITFFAQRSSSRFSHLTRPGAARPHPSRPGLFSVFCSLNEASAGSLA